MNKIEALEYLVEIGPAYTSEWTEAGMYHALVKIIKSGDSFFTQEYLDVLLKEASEF